jgi:site-specific DNA recombinase
MTHELSSFGKWSKSSSKLSFRTEEKAAVVYTRVSSKEQADNNLSLDFQKRVIDEYASRNGYTTVAYFGGTYESAKTDGRKEFQRMQDFIKKNKGKVSHILVYTLDRFSRTGGGAIKLAEDLREKYGVTVFAVTQPADTSNASGVLQQSIHFIFSQYDNQLRKQRAIAGMKEKFQKGIWVVKPPLGYDIVKSGGVRKIVVNDAGKQLRKAFTWKSKGLKNEDIMEKLRAAGVPMYKQQLTKILKNPFYCGLVCHGLLEGQVVEGTHEQLISREIFLKVNDAGEKTAGFGVPHKKEFEELPLKVFLKCSVCGGPFTGYVVRAKNLWYYKCNTKGCRCNKNAAAMHKLFEELLAALTLPAEFAEPLQYQIEATYKEQNKESEESSATFKARLAEVGKKLDTLEEKYYVNAEMSRETFEKFYFRYKAEHTEIAKQLNGSESGLSNLGETIKKAVELSVKLAPMWASSDFKDKERLQKLVFPEGIIYDREKGHYRTERINRIFSLAASLAKVSGEKEKGQTGNKTCLSLSADWTGLEPATSAVTGRHSNQLNYQSSFPFPGAQR